MLVHYGMPGELWLVFHVLARHVAYRCTCVGQDVWSRARAVRES